MSAPFGSQATGAGRSHSACRRPGRNVVGGVEPWHDHADVGRVYLVVLGVVDHLKRRMSCRSLGREQAAPSRAIEFTIEPEMEQRIPPEGFEPHFKKSRVTDPWEPLFSRRCDKVVQLGLWLRDAHCNSRGFVHGGVIAALADNAMGISCVLTNQAATSAVTVSLSVDYVATAKIGQWLRIEPRIVKAGRTLGFVDALISADDKIIARAAATFRILA